jgi:hypothetical protein
MLYDISRIQFWPDSSKMSVSFRRFSHVFSHFPGSFHRSVLAFPPKPRSGCTWTALGASRLLLLGGRSQNRCLADV